MEFEKDRIGARQHEIINELETASCMSEEDYYSSKWNTRGQLLNLFNEYMALHKKK